MASERIPSTCHHVPNPLPTPREFQNASPIASLGSNSPPTTATQNVQQHQFKDYNNLHYVAQPLPVVVRNYPPRSPSSNASRRPSEQTLTHLYSNDYSHSRPISHHNSPSIASPKPSHLRSPSVAAYGNHPADPRKSSYDYWAAGVSPVHKLEYQQNTDVKASPTGPPPFPSISSGERLIINTRKSYDPESLKDDNVEARETESQTLPALIFLALGAFLVSLGIAIYAIFILLITFITTPFRLCSSNSTTTREILVARLLPSLNFQRRCIFKDPITSTPPKPAHSHKLQTEGSTTHSTSDQPHHAPLPVKTGKLIITHLCSPLISLPVSICAWITALAWLPSAMIIHEQTAGVSDDEQRMAERLVGFWSRWLDWCRNDEVDERTRGRERRRRSHVHGGGARRPAG